MTNLQTFLMGLLVISTLTGLTTEAVKKALADHNKTFPINTLTGIVALVISLACGIGYVLIADIGFTVSTVISIITFVFMNWLCAMVGYDKVIQTIGQFKPNKEDTNNG